MSKTVDSIGYDMAHELGNQYIEVDEELAEYAETAESGNTGDANAARSRFMKRVWEHFTDVLDYELVYEVTISRLENEQRTLEQSGFDTEGLTVWMNETAYDLFDAFAKYVFDMYDVALPSRSPHHTVSTSEPVSKKRASGFMTREPSQELAQRFD